MEIQTGIIIMVSLLMEIQTGIISMVSLLMGIQTGIIVMVSLQLIQTLTLEHFVMMVNILMVMVLVNLLKVLIGI